MIDIIKTQDHLVSKPTWVAQKKEILVFSPDSIEKYEEVLDLVRV